MPLPTISGVRTPPILPHEVETMVPEPVAASGYVAHFAGPPHETARVAGHEIEIGVNDDGRNPTFSAEAGKPFSVVVGRNLLRSFGRARRVDVIYCFADGSEREDYDNAVDIPLSLDADRVFLPGVRIPYKTHRVSIWFRGAGDRFDSNFGKNFVFEVGESRPDADPQWKRILLTNYASGFPNLDEGDFVAIGPWDDRFNCIAWSLDDRDHWVWPGDRIEDFDRLYAEHGYTALAKIDLTREEGVHKVALFGRVGRDGRVAVTHAAVSDDEGLWTSKIGNDPLIRHSDPRAVSGGSYGEIVKVYARPSRLSNSSMSLPPSN